MKPRVVVLLGLLIGGAGIVYWRTYKANTVSTLLTSLDPYATSSEAQAWWNKEVGGTCKTMTDLRWVMCESSGTQFKSVEHIGLIIDQNQNAVKELSVKIRPSNFDSEWKAVLQRLSNTNAPTMTAQDVANYEIPGGMYSVRLNEHGNVAAIWLLMGPEYAYKQSFFKVDCTKPLLSKIAFSNFHAQADCSESLSSPSVALRLKFETPTQSSKQYSRLPDALIELAPSTTHPVVWKQIARVIRTEGVGLKGNSFVFGGFDVRQIKEDPSNAFDFVITWRGPQQPDYGE